LNRAQCRRIVLYCLFCFLAQAGFAANDNTATLTIGYYDKRIYYVGDQEHPVLLEIVLTNESSQTYRFKMSDNRMYNLDFLVSTPTNILLDHSQEFTRSRTANQPVFYREMSLEPGEHFGIVVNLGDFVAIKTPGVYSVQALFYPELNLVSAAAPLRSNALTLNVRPAVSFPEEKAQIEAETGMLIQRESIPPDEVVSYVLAARQKSQWEKFFLYLDLESLYLKNPGRAESYRRMSEENRRATLRRYKEQLQAQTLGEDILLIPSSFEILQTTYTANEAQVVVLERFQYRDYVEKKKYTYYLQRHDRIWEVSDYDVLNLGTE
jgi:hypothetical protein